MMLASGPGSVAAAPRRDGGGLAVESVGALERVRHDLERGRSPIPGVARGVFRRLRHADFVQVCHVRRAGAGDRAHRLARAPAQFAARVLRCRRGRRGPSSGCRRCPWRTTAGGGCGSCRRRRGRSRGCRTGGRARGSRAREQVGRGLGDAAEQGDRAASAARRSASRNPPPWRSSRRLPSFSARMKLIAATPSVETPRSADEAVRHVAQRLAKGSGALGDARSLGRSLQRLSASAAPRRVEPAGPSQPAQEILEVRQQLDGLPLDERPRVQEIEPRDVRRERGSRPFRLFSVTVDTAVQCKPGSGVTMRCG